MNLGLLLLSFLTIPPHRSEAPELLHKYKLVGGVVILIPIKYFFSLNLGLIPISIETP